MSHELLVACALHDRRRRRRATAAPTPADVQARLDKQLAALSEKTPGQWYGETEFFCQVLDDNETLSESSSLCWCETVDASFRQLQ